MRFHAKGEKVAGYILKIVLEDTHPPVWRRIIIPEKITFADLHNMIQIIFGWENEHMHDFRIPSKNIWIDDSQSFWGGYHYMEDETPVESFLFNNKGIRYTYDFGDEWRHKIIYEKTDETYGERNAALLKFKGDNFLEDSGEIWEEELEDLDEDMLDEDELDEEVLDEEVLDEEVLDEEVLNEKEPDKEEWEGKNRSPFDPIHAAEKLKELKCPVYNPPQGFSEEITQEYARNRLQGLIDKTYRKIYQKMAAYTYFSCDSDASASQMANKIDEWVEFVKDWEEDTTQKQENTWEIIAPEYKNEKQCGKTNYELLQALSDEEAKNYCKYLQIPVPDTWTKAQLVKAVADTFAEHPEYLLYVFYNDEYAEFMKLMKLPRGERREKPAASDSLIKGVMLGLADVSVVYEKNKKTAKITFASDIKPLLGTLNAKERNMIYRKLNKFTINLKSLILFYGMVELEALYKIYCQLYGETMDSTEFNRYIYWHGTLNSLIITGTEKNGASYAASPDIDLDTVLQKTKQYAADLEYIVYPKNKLKKMADSIIERSQWMDKLYTYLRFDLGLSENMARSMLEEIFCCIMNGAALPFVMKNLEDVSDLLGLKADLALKCELWKYISKLMLDLELPMLKGRSRNSYGEEKKISPWSVEMCEPVDEKKHLRSKNAGMQEFPAEIQELMQRACSFADPDAMKRLMLYQKKENIRSEEFLYLLADAHITGCEFEQAGNILHTLENGSKKAKKAVVLLCDRLERGKNIADGQWDPLDKLFDFIKPRQELSVHQEPFVRKEPKIGRNEPCPCGSGKKYKHCCGK